MSSSLSIGRRRVPSALPGFGLSLGITLFWLNLIVLIPLVGLFLKTLEIPPARIWAVASDPRTLAALKVSFGASLIAATVNLVFGTLVAWVLVRYRFPGRRILDAIVDIPFALPTAVAGIALTTLYAENGLLGSLLAQAGLKVSYTPLGIVVALTFIGLPFVVRTLQPVLEDLPHELEEAAAALGAGRVATIRRVILPAVLPALLAGFALAFARAVGEYGSVIFIAGNMPMISEIAPLLIVIRLDQYQYPEATVIAAIMLLISFALLFPINWLQGRVRRGRLAGA